MEHSELSGELEVSSIKMKLSLVFLVVSIRICFPWILELVHFSHSLAETALSIRDSVVKKLQATVEVSVVERYKLYEIRDREVRLLDDDEFVVPLLRLHKTLLCTNKLNPQGRIGIGTESFAISIESGIDVVTF